MKKIVFGIMSLLMVACAGGEKNAGEGDSHGDKAVRFETYSYDVVAEVAGGDSIENTDGSRYCHMAGEAVIPVKVGKSDITFLRDSLMRLAGLTFVSENRADPRLEAGMKMTTFKPDSADACSSATNTLVVSLLTPRLIVWKDYASSYICKAAHGSYSTTYVNYSVEENKILELSDLMKDGYQKPLAELIRSRLIEDRVDLIVPAEEIEAPSDFRITSTGLTFIYGIYEIAPYSSGEINVAFDGYELDSLLKPGVLNLIYGSSAD